MSKPRDSISVVGSGEASGAPDVLRAVLRVDGRGPDVGAALDAAGAALERVLAAVRTYRVADEDISSAQIGVQPRWGERGQQLGYESAQTITVTVRSLQGGGGLLRGVADAAPDELTIESVVLAISEPGPLLESARDAAFADAKAKAAQYAQLAERGLGRVLRIAEEVGGRPILARRMEMAASKAVPIEAGQEALRSTVTVEWELLD